MSARLSLVVPGCCGPLPENTAAIDQLDEALRSSALWTLLSRADRVVAEQGFHPQLALLFDLPPQSTGFPHAALDLLGEGGTPGKQAWLHADPVCMQADMDHAILFDAHSLQLSQAETDKLIAELNAHFAQDGIALFCHSPSSWYLELDHHRHFSSHALHDVVGRNVNSFMPTGEDAGFWKSFMNEAQMLLHASEINQQREARGHLPVNSLWLWGEGALPPLPPDEREALIQRLVTTNHAARGMAMLNHIACDTTPWDINSITRALDDSAHVCVVMDELFSAVSYADVEVWQKQMLELCEQWLLPLVRATVRRNIPVLLYPCDGSAYEINHSSRLRLWRRGGIRQHLRLYAG